jgi:hypothetical protein
VAKLAAGDACDRVSFDDCGGDLRCGDGGTCVPKPKAGEPCDHTGCAGTLFCRSGTCVELKRAEGGEPCGEDTLCATGMCTAGRCPQAIPDGAACTSAERYSCDPFSRCIDGKCTPLWERVCK